jgi:hypothetical protein
MTLIEVINNLETLDQESTIYASEPWTEDSTALIATEPEEGGIPSNAAKLGLKYFLEVFVARDFIEDWMASLDAKPTPQEKCSRLIQYAVKDA